MSSICCVFNTPSLYRKSIYTLIDKEYDCDWVFENTDNKLETFDTGILRRVTTLSTVKIGPFYWVKGMLRLLKNPSYTQYLMMGHSRNMTTLVFLILKKIFYKSKSAYLWTHGLYGKESWFEKALKKTLYQLADNVLVYGDRSYNLIKDAGIDDSKLRAIHNSLDFDTQLQLRKSITRTRVYASHFGNDHPVLIFIGRLTKVKRLDMILTAIAKLKHRGMVLNLTIVGDGIMRPALEQLATELNIQDNVWFYGASYDEKNNAELIYNADLCVAPGNIGLTAMHVMMFGCPALSHNRFELQMPEYEAIKDGQTGSFFTYDNQPSLNQAIYNWFANPSYNREIIRQNCYNEIDNYWNTYYQMDILSTVLQK